MGLKLLSGFQAIWQLPPDRNLLFLNIKNYPKPWYIPEGSGAIYWTLNLFIRNL